MTKSFSSPSRIALAIAACFVLFAMSGCGSSGSSGGDSAPPSSQDQEAMIQKIQNDPKIPANLKEDAIASIRNPPEARKHPTEK